MGELGPGSSKGSPAMLAYMPQGYGRRRSKAMAFAVFAGVAAAVMAVCDWRGAGLAWWVQGMIVGVPAAMAALALGMRPVECRVEGDSLYFAAENVPPTSVPIMDIEAIDRIDAGENAHYEIVVRGMGRMSVGADVFDPIEPLAAALHAVNPAIRFGTGSAMYCRACGVALFPAGRAPGLVEAVRLLRRRRCPACGQPLPRYGRFV